jgi:hypothetical protein
MPKYNIKYYFDGKGIVTIEAKDKEAAEDKFFIGDFEDESEDTQNYEIASINEF